MKVRIVRGTVVNGRPVAVGDVVEVGERDGELLVRLGRAERVAVTRKRKRSTAIRSQRETATRE